MTKLFALFLVCIIVFATLPVVVLANSDITVTVHGRQVEFPDGQGAVIIDGRVLVPIREVFEAMGFGVYWRQEAQEVVLYRLNTLVVIPINSSTFYVTSGGRYLSDGSFVRHNLDVPAQINNNRTLVPVRHVLESVGYELDWHSATRTVIITSEIGPVVPVVLDTNRGVITDARLAEMVAGGEIPANVTHLHIQGHGISDVSPLGVLTNLVKLNLTANNIRDITPLSHLINMRSLSLWGNLVDDISPIGNFINMRELILWGNEFSEISSLYRLTKLERFSVGGNLHFDGDISVLHNFTGLISLGLGSSGIADYYPISSLSRLEHLELWDAGNLSDISVLGNLPNLLGLTLHGAGTADFVHLGTFQNLLRLNLQNIYIGNTGALPLERLPNLRMLTLSHTNLRDIATLGDLNNLVHLMLPDNNITDISALTRLSNLEFVMLLNNQITDVSPLLGLGNIHTLILSGNPLDDAQIAEINRVFANIGQLEY